MKKLFWVKIAFRLICRRGLWDEMNRKGMLRTRQNRLSADMSPMTTKKTLLGRFPVVGQNRLSADMSPMTMTASTLTDALAIWSKSPFGGYVADDLQASWSENERTLWKSKSPFGGYVADDARTIRKRRGLASGVKIAFRLICRRGRSSQSRKSEKNGIVKIAFRLICRRGPHKRQDREERESAASKSPFGGYVADDQNH